MFCNGISNKKCYQKIKIPIYSERRLIMYEYRYLKLIYLIILLVSILYIPVQCIYAVIYAGDCLHCCLTEKRQTISNGSVFIYHIETNTASSPNAYCKYCTWRGQNVDDQSYNLCTKALITPGSNMCYTCNNDDEDETGEDAIQVIKRHPDFENNQWICNVDPAIETKMKICNSDTWNGSCVSGTPMGACPSP